jgi:hypothetical protein
VWFCHGVFISPWRGQVALRIINPTIQLFYAVNKLSNETSVVSGDLFFVDILKLKGQNSFLSCCKFMASLFHHGEAKSLYESKIRQCGCFMHLTSFLMRPQLSLGTYFLWRFRNLKVKIRFCHVILSWHLFCIMERPLLYKLKIQQCSCFMHLTSFLMRHHSSLGTYFSWRFEILKFNGKMTHFLKFLI